MENLDLGYDLNEALIRTNICRDDLDRLRQNLPCGVPTNLTDKQLLLFLNACGNIDDAARVIKIYYDSRKLSPEHFDDRDPNSREIKQCFKNQYYFTVKPTEAEKCPIIYHKLNNSTASNYMFDNACKTYSMTIDAALYKYGPYPGVIFVHDMEHVGFMHILRASISGLKKYLYYLQYGLPAKLCRVHVLNVNVVFNRLLKLLTPFLKKELLEVIHVHTTTMDYEEFHKKWIPKSHLPSDYGGDLSSNEEMTLKFYTELKSLRGYFAAEQKQRENVKHT